jgi:UDP-N-acetylmuramoyl-tripeptide--D-alanyl-D-alanine ligase
MITNIGTAHIEGFGTFEGVVKAKTELYEYLRKVNGIALYNDKDQLLSEKIYKLINRAVPFSDPTGVDLVIETAGSGLLLELKANYMHKDYLIKTNLFGSYNFDNVKAAIATGLFFEVEMDQIVKKVKNYTPENNRSQVTVKGTNTVIRDAYNANPSSMKLAIEAFAALESPGKLCILGDMLELADKAKDEHRQIIELLKKLNLKEAVLLGQNFSEVSKGSGFRAFTDIKKLKEHLKSANYNGYHILVKGSRGMEMEKIYDDL